MSKNMVVILSAVLLMFSVTDNIGLSQSVINNPIRFMFYNVENLFDVYNDTLKNDDDFLPEGVMRWNSGRYNLKINSVYKVIAASGEWSPPAVAAFCEVENRNVLEDLVYGTYLSRFSYKIVHEESPDLRGIDVCLIYRNDLIALIGYNYWVPSKSKAEDFTTRSVLYARFKANTDTIHLIVNHWPSRRGGALSAASLRIKIESMVKLKADSIYRRSGGKAKIVIMGDFNCSPEDIVMKSLIDSDGSESYLVNLSQYANTGINGTYRYKGIWEMPDQILVSEELLSSTKGYFTNTGYVTIFSPDFLLIKDPVYPGFTPFSTYRGFRYQGGISDHLPVIISLFLRDPVQQE